MTAQQIRERFTKFFVKHQHRALASSSLVPDNDPTVLLTTAGMQQFKPYFLGEKDPVKDFQSKRITTIQKSFRTSDIDEVGDTSHLTFFEMLGNFSFGDYGKKEAIDLAWEFLTKTMHLSSARLWVTIFAGDSDVPRDHEAEKAWLKHVPKDRLIELGRGDNFWGPPGASGSCGPSSEIHWQIKPDQPGRPGQGNENFLEIWNLVFTEYFMDENGALTDLPQKNIDTGMGLERLAMVTQKVAHIYDTDLYKPIMAAILKLPDFGESEGQAISERRARIVADHVRGACFLIADGVKFSNKEQGYILRRIIRRAADQFMANNFSFDPIVDVVVREYDQAYPNLPTAVVMIKRSIATELEQYRKILQLDVHALVKKIRKSGGESAQEPMTGVSHIELSPDEAFLLFSTHGISLDRLERLGYTFNKGEVEEQIAAHQEKSRAGAVKKFGGHGLGHGLNTIDLTEDEVWKVTRLHTATHLLHAALRKILGESVQQNGSDINPERLRFDFSFDRKLSDNEKKLVLDLVNRKIEEDLPVSWKMETYNQAIADGALAFFKDKYGQEVKVYTIGDFSKELCGGPHVEHTKQVGPITIASEQSVGSGIRRIKATVE